MNQISVVGIDLAKTVFQIHAVDKNGKMLERKAIRRLKLLSYFANIPPCLIGMEACSSAHYWARKLEGLGHQVKLMAPQYVKPYVKTNKNDANDAEAICEAVTRPNMRFVPPKSEEQQALLLIHRERDGIVKERTALINRIRATLGEFGIVIPVGPRHLHDWFLNNLADAEMQMPEILVQHVMRMKSRLNQLESDLDVLERTVNQTSQNSKLCRRLEAVPGIGRLAASAIVAGIGDGKFFASGRQFSAWLGLVPKQNSSGGKQRLMGISKRGDGYLRRLLIHGARAVIRHMNPKRPITEWLTRLICRSHKNVVIVALANKLARIAWALLTKDVAYREIAA